MDTTAQNADRPADNCSTDRHHTSTPIGLRKYRPARTVGQVSGRVGLVILISVGRSGGDAEIRSSQRYRATNMALTTPIAAAPATASTPPTHQEPTHQTPSHHDTPNPTT